MTGKNQTPRCLLCGGETRLDKVFYRRRFYLCPSCDFLFRWPRPPGEPYCFDFQTEWRVAQRRIPLYLKVLDQLQPGQRLCDIGCSLGMFVKLARDRGFEAVGMDITPQAVQAAREHLKVPAVQSLDELQPPFDVVTLWNVVECASDPIALLAKSVSLLREGGQLFVRTQNLLWHRTLFSLGFFLHKLGLPLHTLFIFNRNTFSPKSLRIALEKAGLTVEQLSGSVPVLGDPYAALPSERMALAFKRLAFSTTRAVAAVSGGRILLMPSLEAWCSKR